MTITEAEKCFKRYEGFFFHMGREEPTLYDAYKALNISEETEEQWRQEIIEDYFEQLLNVSDDASLEFSMYHDVSTEFNSVIKIIWNTHTLKEENCIKLISVIEKMSQLEHLNKLSKILIIEHIRGGFGHISYDACSLICMNTSAEQRKRMNEAVLKLADFTCTDEDKYPSAFGDIKERHKKAVENYKARYEIYKDANPPRPKIETLDDLYRLVSGKQPR